MSQRTGWLMLLLAVSLHACDKDAAPTTPTPPSGAPAQPPFVSVSGRVIDYTTNMAVPDATLEWRNSGGLGVIPNSTSELRGVVTDPTGSYTLPVPAVGRYLVSIRVGTRTGEASVIVPAKSYRTDFFVNPGNCLFAYGFIFDEVTRMPVAGAQIAWIGRALSAADGGYRIQLGCGGTYGGGTTSFVVSHPGYSTFFSTGGRGESLSLGGILRKDVALTRP